MMFWLRQNGSATADNDGCSSGTVLAITNLTLTWLSSFRLIRRYDMFARTHTRTYTRTHTRVCAHVRMNARTHSSLFKNLFWLKIRGWRTSFKFITTFCYCSYSLATFASNANSGTTGWWMGLAFSLETELGNWYLEILVWDQRLDAYRNISLILFPLWDWSTCTHYTSNWCCGQDIWPKPMKCLLKKRSLCAL